MLLLKTSPRFSIPLRIAIPVLFVFIMFSLVPIHDSLAFFGIDSIIGAFRLLLLGLPILIVALVSFLLNFLTAIILAIGGLALQFAMVVTGTMKLTSGGIVDLGWTITRDFVNLFFILILVAIALATILGVEQYAVKKTLPKLLLALLFINFSKVLIGVGIDIVHIIARVFLDPVSSSNLAAQFLTSTGAFVEFFKQIWEASTTGFTEMFSVTLQFMIQMLLGAIFNVFLAFVLLVMALVFIARIVIIWILVIISPLTIAASTLPITASHFTTWKKQLIQWVVLILPVSFFIYLGFAFLQSGVPAFTDTLQELGPELQETLNLPSAFEGFATVIFAIFKQLLIVVTLAMIMLGGLAYGFQTSRSMAEFRGMKIGEDMLKRVKGLRTSRMGLRTQTIGAGALAAATRLATRGSSQLNKIPVVGSVVGPITRRTIPFRAAERAAERLKFTAEKKEREERAKRVEQEGGKTKEQYERELYLNLRKRNEAQARADAQTITQREKITNLEQKQKSGIELSELKKQELATALTQKQSIEDRELKEVTEQRDGILNKLGELYRDTKKLNPDTAQGVLAATEKLNLSAEDLKKVFGKQIDVVQPNGTTKKDWEEPDYAALDKEFANIGLDFSDRFRKRVIHILDKIIKPLEGETRDSESFKNRVRAQQERMLEFFKTEDVENLSRDIFTRKDPQKDAGTLELQDLLMKKFQQRHFDSLFRNDRLGRVSLSALNERAQTQGPDWFFQNGNDTLLRYFATGSGARITGLPPIGGLDNIDKVNAARSRFQNKDRVEEIDAKIKELQALEAPFRESEKEIEKLTQSMHGLTKQLDEMKKGAWQGLVGPGGIEQKTRETGEEIAKKQLQLQEKQTELQQKAEKREEIRQKRESLESERQRLSGTTRRRTRRQRAQEEEEEE